MFICGRILFPNVKRKSGRRGTGDRLEVRRRRSQTDVTEDQAISAGQSSVWKNSPTGLSVRS